MGQASFGARARRVAASVVAAVAALLLAGCGSQNAPGVAAEVGDERITDEQVDGLAEALCVLNAGSPQETPLTTQQLRRQALQVLLDNALAADLVDPDDVDKQQVRAARQQAAASLETLPERLRPHFEDAVEAFATAQLGLTALGRDALVEDGTARPDQQAALAEGQRLRARYAEEVGVSVDPRFGTFKKGQLRPSDGSVSVAVSDLAKASSAGDGLGAELPANLTCNPG